MTHSSIPARSIRKLSGSTKTLRNGSGDLTLGATAADGGAAILWFSAGQAGTNYAVTLSIVTRNGRTISRVVRLPVLALSSAAMPDIVLLAGPGSGLTDENGNPIMVP